MFNKSGRSSAYDAGTSSSLAFLNAQLEYASPELVKPLTSMTHPRDIDVEIGGGFVDFISQYASNYGTTGGNQYGLQGTRNTEIANVQVDINKGIWQAWNWAAAFSITDIELKKLANAKRYGQPAPFSLQEMLEEGVQLVWNKAMERVTYLGWLGQPGLINSSQVTSSLAPATGSGGLRTWASKTPVQIQTDINFGINQTVANSQYSLEGMCDTLLVDWAVYSVLTQPMALGGVGGYKSVLEYVIDNNVAKQNGIDFKILPLANPWIATQGAGSTSRGVFYRNDKKTVKLRAPVAANKIMTVPSTKDGGSYESVFNGCIGQVQFLRTQPFYYLDGLA